MQDLPASLSVSSVDTGDTAGVRLAVAGEIDAHSAPGLQQRLTDAAADDMRLVLDLAGVTFMDSSGLRVMIAESTRRTEAGGEFVLAEVPRSVARLLDVSGVSDHLAVESSA